MQALPALALATQAAGPIVSGIMANSAAQAEKKRNDINAFIGRTRAIQTDTSARQGLESELGTLRAAFGGNGDRPSVGTFEIMDELRQTRDRERRINFGNRMSEAADYKQAGRNAAARGRGGLLTGLVKSGPSLFDLYDYSQG